MLTYVRKKKNIFQFPQSIYLHTHINLDTHNRSDNKK